MTEKNSKGTKSANAFWGNIFSRYRSRESIDNLEALRLCPLFRRLNVRELKKVAGIVYERSYQAGEYLFEKDQPGAAMFIVKSGKVAIIVPGADGSEAMLAEIAPEEFMGELALLDDTPRSASARAIEKTDAIAFFREDLNEMLDTYPVIASKILKELSIIIGQRLKASNEQLYSRGKLNE
jgi:CRP/FNR family cyclic AMP-dependent transcriptional regulator